MPDTASSTPPSSPPLPFPLLTPAGPLQTNPLAAGSTTSEGVLAHIVVILATVIAALGTITGLVQNVTNVVPASPELSKWLAIGGVAVASLTQIAYGLQRGAIKVAAINAGAIGNGKTAEDAAADLGATK